MQMISKSSENPLATRPIGMLILKFAIPATISFLVNALYNIIDQIFIGQGVGLYGNAATNVVFPLTTIATAIALLLGVGSASNFNLKIGAGKHEQAGYIVGNGLFFMVLFGVILATIVLIFLNPLLNLFGATENVFELAQVYTSITAFGIPLSIFATASCQLIRADGSPVFSMICLMSGAILNTVLDPIFIFVFKMGMAGAAWATVLGQFVSAVIACCYFLHFKTVKLNRYHFKPSSSYLKMIASLGVAACFNQLAMTVVQIVMNNTLTYYGTLSEYGKDIPLACVGVISKVNIVYLAFSLGIAQGCQPINGFNYGAKNYHRVRKTYFTAAAVITVISMVFGLAFQIFPRQIVAIFGGGSELYFQFAQRYFRIFMLMTFVNGIQPLTANFFTSIGKAKRGVMMSLTRQILFLLPLIVIFPIFFGIDGVMYAGPIADGVAFILACLFIWKEMKQMSTLS